MAGDEVYDADPKLRATAHGPRLYSWAWFRLLAEDDPDTGVHHLLIRRNDTTGEFAYLRCCSPRPVPLHTLVAVAGQRWRIEESFQTAKGLVGLDQHQVRRWTSWHRWATLAMLARAFLAVATAIERDTTPTPVGLIVMPHRRTSRARTGLSVSRPKDASTVTTAKPANAGNNNSTPSKPPATHHPSKA